MRVTLGYAWGGFAPDETIDVADTLGRRLLREGKARAAVDEPIAPPPPPEPLNLDYATVAELKAYVLEQGIELDPSVRKRLDIVEAIRAAQQQTRAPESEGTPDAGDDHQEATDVR